MISYMIDFICSMMKSNLKDIRKYNSKLLLGGKKHYFAVLQFLKRGNYISRKRTFLLCTKDEAQASFVHQDPPTPLLTAPFVYTLDKFRDKIVECLFKPGKNTVDSYYPDFNPDLPFKSPNDAQFSRALCRVHSAWFSFLQFLEYLHS